MKDEISARVKRGMEHQKRFRKLVPSWAQPPEADPTGRDAHSPGAKLDQGKPRAALVLQDFGPALLRVADVGTFGAAKYTPHGWISVPDGEERYLDAAMRHLLKQGADDDSGIDHLAHAAWNVLAALTLRIQSETK